MNIFYLVSLTFHNCAIACTPFGTPKFFHELQIYLTQHGCLSTCRTGVYCRLEASAGHSNIVPLAIRHHLFLGFWLVNTWFFAHPHDHRAVTCLNNIHQLNIRRGKKLDSNCHIHNLLFGVVLVHKNIQIVTNSIGCIQYARAFGHSL